MSLSIEENPPETKKDKLRPIWNPPNWFIIGLGIIYLVIIGGLLFWPGATFLDRLHFLDGGICGQIPTHTFTLGDQKLPLCVRCTGMYLGFSLGVFILILRGRRRAQGLPGPKLALLLLSGIAFMGIDGFNSLFTDINIPHLYQPNNVLRLITGLLTGIAMAAFLMPSVNSILWKQRDPRLSVRSVRELGLQILGLVLIGLVTLSQASFLLYPIAIISSIGALAALSSINLTFVVVILGGTERYERYRQILPIASIALFLACCELLGLSWINHLTQLL
jgi:uncharacterized membrane protein